MGTQGTGPDVALILAAGEIRDYNTLAEGLPPGVFVICADAGLRHCAPLGLAPDLLIGDFDSLGAPPPEGVERIELDTDKNYTDTHHAVLEAAARGYSRLILAGMLGGGRPEHAQANIGTLLWCAEHGLDAALRDGVSEMVVLCGEGASRVLPNREDCFFSLLALGDCEGVTILGGRYPLDDYDLTPGDPRAVSNEFVGQDVRVRLRRGRVLAVCTPKGAG